MSPPWDVLHQKGQLNRQKELPGSASLRPCVCHRFACILRMCLHGDHYCIFRGQRLLEGMQDAIETDQNLLDKNSAELETNGSVLIIVRTGICTLLDKLEEIKLKSPLHSFTKVGFTSIPYYCRTGVLLYIRLPWLSMDNFIYRLILLQRQL